MEIILPKKMYTSNCRKVLEAEVDSHVDHSNIEENTSTDQSGQN